MFWCYSRKYLLIVSRSRVTKQHAPKRRDVHPKRPRPACDNSLVLPRELLCIPANHWPELFRDFRGLFAGKLLEDDAIAIPGNELNRKINRKQKVERLAWHRAGKDIAPDDDLIDARAANIFDDRLEGGKIPMDVVQRCEADREALLRTWSQPGWSR